MRLLIFLKLKFNEVIWNNLKYWLIGSLGATTAFFALAPANPPLPAHIVLSISLGFLSTMLFLLGELAIPDFISWIQDNWEKAGKLNEERKNKDA